MKKKGWILSAGMVLVVVLGFVMVSHAGRQFSGPMGLAHMYRFNVMSEELGLTGAQRAALKGLFKNHRQEIQSLVKVLVVKKRALQELVLAENPDRAAIRQAADEMGRAIAETAILGSVLAQKAQAILTPEQLTRFREWRQNRQKAFDGSLREWQEGNPAF
jgi:Spy/CpxP family protein refolding chaperone